MQQTVHFINDPFEQILEENKLDEAAAKDGVSIEQKKKKTSEKKSNIVCDEKAKKIQNMEQIPVCKINFYIV